MSAAGSLIAPYLKKWLAVIGVLATVGWVSFFDSHSILRRVTWQAELNRLTAENEQLVARISSLEQELAKGLSDDTVERIARTEYGMHRPGETVYYVEKRP